MNRHSDSAPATSNESRLTARWMVVSLVAISTACGGSSPPPEPTDESTAETAGDESAENEPTEPRIEPPPSGTPRDVQLPPVTRTDLANGLELDVVPADSLPIVYVRLVIKSGLASDPPNMPGLSRLVAVMLEEGTRRKTSSQFAEAVDFLGAQLEVVESDESISIQFVSLAEHLDEVMALLGEMVTTPRFDNDELRQMKQRELVRIELEAADPGQLAYKQIYRELYPENHPYHHTDATAESLGRITRRDVVSWHQQHFVPNNAFLIVVGAVTPEQVQQSAQRVLGRWRRRNVSEPTFPELPTRTERRVTVIHRPRSAQSMIAIGNLALERANPDWVPLKVANQVLGGSSASRLFQDLREERSLTYGAYSSVDERPHPALFRARGAVGADPRQPDVSRAPAAVDAMFEHLERIVREAPPESELAAAKSYLSGSFALSIQTAGQIAHLVEDSRLFGLPDDYWDTYRSQIEGVSAATALTAARAHIHPETSIVVVVGDGEALAEPLRRWGAVRVVDANGTTISELPAAESTEAQAAPAETVSPPPSASATSASADPAPSTDATAGETSVNSGTSPQD